jgi:diphthamide synthase (EF-2-diphthine--ammonia ligase)
MEDMIDRESLSDEMASTEKKPYAVPIIAEEEEFDTVVLACGHFTKRTCGSAPGGVKS